MKAPNLLALTASILFTAGGLAAMNENVTRVLPNEINGVKVIDLAPVVVHPSAEDLRSAALLPATTVAANSVASVEVRAKADRVLGAQLVMPYYSFGSAIGRISKD